MCPIRLFIYGSKKSCNKSDFKADKFHKNGILIFGYFLKCILYTIYCNKQFSQSLLRICRS